MFWPVHRYWCAGVVGVLADALDDFDECLSWAVECACGFLVDGLAFEATLPVGDMEGRTASDAHLPSLRVVLLDAPAKWRAIAQPGRREMAAQLFGGSSKVRSVAACRTVPVMDVEGTFLEVPGLVHYVAIGVVGSLVCWWFYWTRWTSALTGQSQLFVCPGGWFGL